MAPVEQSPALAADGVHGQIGASLDDEIAGVFAGEPHGDQRPTG